MRSAPEFGKHLRCACLVPRSAQPPPASRWVGGGSGVRLASIQSVRALGCTTPAALESTSVPPSLRPASSASGLVLLGSGAGPLWLPWALRQDADVTEVTHFLTLTGQRPLVSQEGGVSRAGILYKFLIETPSFLFYLTSSRSCEGDSEMCSRTRVGAAPGPSRCHPACPSRISSRGPRVQIGGAGRADGADVPAQTCQSLRPVTWRAELTTEPQGGQWPVATFLPSPWAVLELALNSESSVILGACPPVTGNFFSC